MKKIFLITALLACHDVMAYNTSCAYRHEGYLYHVYLRSQCASGEYVLPTDYLPTSSCETGTGEVAGCSFYLPPNTDCSDTAGKCTMTALCIGG